MSDTTSSTTASSGRPPFREILREKELWLLLAAGLILFARPLLTEETFFFRDLYVHFYPEKRLVGELLRNGELPLWDRYVHGGQPLLANMNNAALYPTALLYLILPPVTAFNVDIVFHLLGAAVAAYCLARMLGLGPAGALTCGAVYGYCGLQLSLPNVWLYAAVHMPLLLLFWHLHWIEQKRRWFLLLVMTGMIQVLAGRPEWPPVGWAFLLLWSFVYPYPFSAARKVFAWAFACFCTIGLSSIQLLPMLELLDQSTGTRGADATAFTAWSIPARRLPELFIPAFFGRTDSAYGHSYWGAQFEDAGFPYMLSIYWGPLTLLFAFIAGISRNTKHQLTPGARKFLLVFAVLCIVLSLGKHLPGFPLLLHVPGINLFRYPSKLMIGALLPLALLAGYAVDTECMRARMWTLVLIAVTGIAAIIALLFAFDDTARWISSRYFHVRYEVPLLLPSVHFTAVLLAACVAIFAARQGKLKTLATALAVIVLVDLVIAGKNVNAFAPSEFLKQPPATAAWLQSNIGDHRFYRAPTPGNVEILPEGPQRYQVDRWHLETLDSYMAAMYGIRVIFHEDLDRLGAARIQHLNAFLQKVPWDKKMPILSTASVRYFVSSDIVNHPAARPLFRIKNHSNRNFFLYENLGAATPVRFVHESRTASSQSELLELISRSSFDPERTVLLESPPPDPSTQEQSRASIRRVAETSNRIALVVTTESAGYLVSSETDSPGWNTFVDGRQVSALRANYAFVAVAVSAGTHTVERIYRPPAVIRGSLMSVCFLFLLIVVAAITPRMLKPRPA